MSQWITKGASPRFSRFCVIGFALVGAAAAIVVSALLLRRIALEERFAFDDSYHSYDEDRVHWRHNPNLTYSVEQIIEERRSQGRELSVQHLEASYERLGYRLSDTAFSINEGGFKGPSIDPSHSHPRIVMLGDSCTFGSLFDRFSYPRVAERALKERALDWEVVNGGVEGYSPDNLIQELPTYLSLRPEVVTLLIGWNAIYRSSLEVESASDTQLESQMAQLWRTTQEGIFSLLLGAHRYASWQLRRERHPDKNSPELARIEGYHPPSLNDIDALVQVFQSNGAHVVLMTLPGIYTMEEEPSPLSLTKGHLPPYTRNPYVLAKITQQYNDGIRKLAEALHTKLIDLDAWSRTALLPRDQAFLDAVHLNEASQEKEGLFIADQLAPYLLTLQSTH